MFKPGDRVVLHDGTTVTIRKKGQMPRRSRQRRGAVTEVVPIRGFVRGALVNADGTEEPAGPYYENQVTRYGIANLLACMCNLAGSSAAHYWGIGSHTVAATSDFASQASTYSVIPGSEWALNSNSGANSGSRAILSAAPGTQAVSASLTLSQSYLYASSAISNNVWVNCIAQFGNVSVATASCLSIASFAGSSKSNNQQLSVTYNWALATA